MNARLVDAEVAERTAARGWRSGPHVDAWLPMGAVRAEGHVGAVAHTHLRRAMLHLVLEETARTRPCPTTARWV